MEKPKKAVALKYDNSKAAPTVEAKGKGKVAQRILDKAKEADVPVFEDKNLVEELTKLDLGNNIPPELYEVVAQILVFISDLDELEGYKRALSIG